MEQFTAIEVRQHGNCLDSPEREMLYAFADMLEAREKAEPVGMLCIEADDSNQYGKNARFIYADVCMDLSLGRHEVYTHPAPSDADRLAEALRGILEIGKRNMENQKYDGFFNAAREALAAHSAQAQPPADQFDPERNVRPGDVGTELQTAEQDAANFGTGFEVDGRRVAPERVRIFRGEHAAQPPAASVTDAMVDRAQDCLHDKGKDIGYYHMRAALEAALAAQENPNG